ncbi:hypothetical protein OTB20_38065 [Streptomyces sp. H27-H1]|uniref:hypothetical protein n=1 Tax=Streptomyces sp. H27-H1 TaxID=2996461 RepID=UPI002271103A|nr:hypothetical protein [Streptomyces sp. H27-H1]MCY0931882.1 hypothetical protein [Streptomyces sp. H27-H1]
MPAPLPVPIEFRLPDGWLPARPDGLDTREVAFAAVHPHPDDGYAASITIAGQHLTPEQNLAELADSAVQQLHDLADPVEVVSRIETGSPQAPVLIQRIHLTATAGTARRELVLSQVYLNLQDVTDHRRHAMIRLTLTATAAQHDTVLPEFQQFVRTVRPDTGPEA